MSALLKPEKPKTKRYIEQYIEMSLDEFSDEDLIAELEYRRATDGLPKESSVGLEQMRYAMSRRDHATALELLRTYLQDTLGCLLP